MSQGPSVDVDRVVDVVTAAPGLTYAQVVRRLRRRRSDALEHVRAAVTAGLLFEGPTTVRARGGSRRSGPVGLFPEPLEDVDDQVLPLDAGDLRALREGAGITLEALAHQLGVTRGLVHLWESGRQPMPAWAARDLPEALEDAQTSEAPTRGRDARRRRELVAEVRRRIEAGESTTRYQLAGRRLGDRRLLEQARRAGELHEAPAWIRAGWSRHQALALFPGPRPRRTVEPTVSVAALRRAREAAEWSQEALAARLGVARTTIERWEREGAVPGWATAAAAAALVEAREAARDRAGEVLAAITAEPGLSRRALASRLRYTRGEYIGKQLAQLLAGGLIHEKLPGRRGLRLALYPGPAPAEVLTGAQLRGLRERAGLTQGELGDQVASRKQTIGDWERGVGPIPLEWQQRLRAHLEALPAASRPAHLRRADLMAAGELLPTLLEAIWERRGLTRFQVECLGLAGSRREVDKALAELEDQGLIHRGRVGAERVGRAGRITLGRVGYLPGPATSDR